MQAANEVQSNTDWRLLEIEDPKNSDEPFLIGVKINRESCIAPTGVVVTAKIKLRAYALAGALGQHTINRLLVSMGGSFQARYPANEFAVTGGNMMVDNDARGLRLGTYLQNEVIAWAKSLEQHGTVRSILLDEGDALTLSARDRRNRFYEQFGITFVWNNPQANGIERAGGTSTPGLRVAQLATLEVINGVRSFNLEAGLHHFVTRGRQAEIARRRAEEWRKSAEVIHQKQHYGERRGCQVVAFAAGIGWVIALVLAGVVGSQIQLRIG